MFHLQAVVVIENNTLEINTVFDSINSNLLETMIQIFNAKLLKRLCFIVTV